MNAIKTVVLASLLALGGTFSASASAQTMDHSAMHAGGASAPAADMTDGEIRKIDKESKKCWRRSKFDPPCRLNIDPGLGAGIG